MNRIIGFDANTCIPLYNAILTKIEDMKLGSILYDGSKVIAKQKILNNEYLYLYKYLYKINGDFLVKINSKWIKIKDSKFCNQLDDKPEYIYCISTSNSQINIYETILQDYGRSTNSFLNLTINSIILNYLNRNNKDCNSSDYSYASNSLESGFDANTLIYNKEGIVKINELQIGDKLKNDNEVLGIVHLLPSHFTFYKYNGYIVSSNTKIKEDNIWKNIECVSDIKKCETPDECINIITSSGLIHGLYGNVFVDYVQVNNDYINKIVGNILTTYYV